MVGTEDVAERAVGAAATVQPMLPNNDDDDTIATAPPTGPDDPSLAPPASNATTNADSNPVPSTRTHTASATTSNNTTTTTTITYPPPSSSSPNTSSSSIPPCLGWRQVGALMQKNLKTKYRTPLPTFCELFSPALMMLILLAAYTLSEVIYKDAKMYSTIDVALPGPWLHLLDRTSEFTNATLDDLDVVVGNSNRKAAAAAAAAGERGEFMRRLVQKNAPKHYAHAVLHNQWDVLLEDVQTKRNLQLIDVEDDEEDYDFNASQTDRDVFDVLDDAQIQLRLLLRNPLPTPTLEQYIQLSDALASTVDADALPRVTSESSFGRQWGNLLTLGTLHLSPNTQLTRDFVSFLNDSYPILQQDALLLRVHESEQDGIEFINDHLTERTWALLHFASQQDDDDEFRYKIRMNYTTLPNTHQIIDYVSIGLNTEYQRYYLSGYLTLQRTLNEFALTRVESCQDVVLPEVWSMPMPTAAYSQNVFFQAVGFLLGLTIAMAYLYTTSRLIKSMVEEKETRMRETLFILGVRPWAHWWSWLLTSLIVFFIVTFFVTWILSNNVLKHSSPAYLFTYIGLFSTSAMGFSFFVASFFSKAKLSAILGPILLFATLLPRYIFFGTNRYEATVQKKWASLLPCTAFAFGADIVADYEYAEQGIQSWNADEGEYSFNTTLGFLFFDTLLYLFLGWYIDLVIPRQYGVARKWYFLCTPEYWRSALTCCFVRSERPKAGRIGSVVYSSEEEEVDGEGQSAVEPVNDPSLIPRVQVRHLVKKYSKKADVPPAVNDLNLVLYESQITCLLGHNGAGKTSAVSVLTGLYPPTSGDCIVYGHSVVDNLAEARQSMGICPQHNVLFESLTVLEHFYFFQRIKGIQPIRRDLKDKAKEIGLGDFYHVTSSALSGGNKRKLSVAIALCGDPALLLLDEPTSGMDPASRRACWELLRRKREGRVTLLTTHFMDEAELLADRIAVMKEGELQCCGSGLFLKNRFGVGYNLTVVLGEAGERQSLASQNRTGDEILAFLRNQIPDTELMRRSAREVTFRFPQGSDSQFPDMFDALEQERQRFGIGAYGISNATLEEVFLRLAESDVIDIDTAPVVDAQNAETNPPEAALDSQDVALVAEDNGDPIAAASSDDDFKHLGPIRQIALLYYKRVLNQRRDLMGAFFIVVVPVILIALVLLVLMIDIPLAGPPIETSVSLYRKSPSGSGAETDILVAGGAALQDQDAAETEIAALFGQLDGAIREEYPMANLFNLGGLNSSNDLSQHLLDTYNDHNHNARYGAFALKDIIRMNLHIDWEAIQLFLPNVTVLPDFVVSAALSSFLPVSDVTVTGDGQYEVDLETSVSVLHNASSPHAIAAFNQAYMESLYKSCSPNPDTTRLVSVNHPLPLTDQQSIEIKVILSVLASMFLLIPFCYIPAAFVVFLVKERVCKSKHLQLVSGVNMTSFWVSTYLFDLTLFSFLTMLTMAVFLAYGTESAQVFVGSVESFCATMVLILGYGLSGLPFAYLLSRMFGNHSSAQIGVMGINFIFGFVAVNAYYIMSNIQSTQSVAEKLRPLFRTWPAYNIGDGLIELSSAFWEREILGNDTSPFDWDVAGKPIFIIYVLAVPYSLLLLMLEYSADGGSGGLIGGLLRTVRGAFDSCSLSLHGVRKGEGGNSLLLNDGLDGRSPREEDADVVEERDYVNAHRLELKKSASVLLVNLWKVYPPSVGMFGSFLNAVGHVLACVCCFPCYCFSLCFRRRSRSRETSDDDDDDEGKAFLPKRAVRGVSTAVTEGETYGLLGANGAGKSTTLSILTGDIAATAGEAYVVGNDVTGRTPGGVSAARQKIGFCPQVDPLLDLMTGRETLSMFGRLRGVPEDRLKSTVDELLDRLTLTPHADKTSVSYSGGNKRKLSLGVALIGDPRVLFVDEASSGMDPSARRHMWELLEEASRRRSVILTTHLMEEAEALCTRVGIMANGQLMCLGSVQHLKSKYLDGYLIDIHCSGGTPDATVDRVVERTTSEVLPGSHLVERHGRFLRFEVSSLSTFGLGATFRRLQSLKEDSQLCVENYSISQCTLERVFIQMVRSNNAPLETA